MKKTIAIVLLVVAAALLATVYSTREPSADGRTLSEWLELGLEDFQRETPINTEVTNAVRKIGAAAVPTLLVKFRVGDSSWKQKLDNKWGQKIFPRRWFYSAGRQKYEAAYGFAILGTQAVSALPELSRMCLDTNNSGLTGRSLGYLGPEALVFLKSALTNRDSAIRNRAAWGTVATREMARLALPEILTLRNESDWHVAYTALDGAGHVLPEAEFLIIATNFLHSGNSNLQAYALRFTGQYCTNSPTTIPFILPFLTNSIEFLRKDATNALLKIDPKLVAAQGVSPPLQH